MLKQGITIIVILLLIGIAVAPSINANVGKADLDAIIENDIDFQGDVSEEDCGCNDGEPTRWNFPCICTLLYPVLWLAIGLYIASNVDFLLNIMIIIGFTLDCFWYHVFGPSQILEGRIPLI